MRMFIQINYIISPNPSTFVLYFTIFFSFLSGRFISARLVTERILIFYNTHVSSHIKRMSSLVL